jgi:RHS repeat-associated protein
MYHAEGRAYRSGTTWQYEYTLKDHLGNSRVTFADLDNNGTINPTTEILQENHYYPFGMNQESKWLNNTALPDTKYQYNGKELNEDLGLNWNDYGARWYDATIGRWNVADPLSEKMANWSPYNYAFNNPIRFIDPDGMESRDIYGNTTFSGYAGVDEYGNVVGTTTGNAHKPPNVYIIYTDGVSFDTKAVKSNVERIFGKQGIKINVSVISFDEAKKNSDFTWTWDSNNETGSLQMNSDAYSYAIINHNGYPHIGETESDANNNTVLNQFYYQGALTTSYFHSVNQKAIESAQMFSGYGHSSHYSMSYMTAYVVAHEVLHKMLIRAEAAGYSIFYTNSTGEQAKHSNIKGNPNLNSDGNNVRIPAFPSTRLHPVERILESHLKFLKSFLHQN